MSGPGYDAVASSGMPTCMTGASCSTSLQEDTTMSLIASHSASRLPVRRRGSRMVAIHTLAVAAVAVAALISACSLGPGSPPRPTPIPTRTPTASATPQPARVVYLASNDAASPSGALTSHVSALSTSTGAIHWRVQLAGLIAAAPVVASGGDMIYVSTTLPDAILALAASDGKALWRTLTDAETIGVAADSSAVYLGTSIAPTSQSAQQTGSVDAYRRSDGRRLWRAPLDGPAMAPAVADGTVLAGVIILPTTSTGLGTGSLVALAASDGKPLWHAALAYPPTAPTVSGGGVFIGAGATSIDPAQSSAKGSIEARRASDGKLLWRVDLTGSISGLVAAAGAIYVSITVSPSPDGPPADRLEMRATSNGKLLWRVQPVGYVPFACAVGP